jgi:hypothetical protein
VELGLRLGIGRGERLEWRGRFRVDYDKSGKGVYQGFLTF